MTIRVRALLVAVATATILLAGCDHYVCTSGATFGNSSCTASSSGLGGTGSGGNGSAAYVYAVDEGTNGAANGTIDGYALDTTAVTFGPIASYTAPTVPLNTGGTGMVVAQGTYLYAAFGATDQIFGWTISSTGALTSIAGTPITSPAAGGYIGGVGQDNMITNPAGTLLFISDAATDSIYVYSIGSGGVLTQVGTPVSCPSTFTPMNLATDGLGKYLYVIDGFYGTHQGAKVAAFSIGTGSNLGVLNAVSGSPFSFPMWQLKGEPTGKYLVGTSGSSVLYSGQDDPKLYVFSITQTGTNAGAITQVGTEATNGSPFSIAMQSNANGSLVYAFGIQDSDQGFDEIEGFSISSSGGLTPANGEPFSLGEGSWGQFDQSGALLFTYASFLDINTNTIVTQISPLSVGSGGMLTEPTSNTTLVTPGFWAVADAP